ncbi:hypothetical protein LCGC14_1500710 [marine sediment metagenome]|uniref:Methylated-DNA-[protein]-cysteine S-methyltransferase DNA binding domain-containing protein n=1 Tax=marine sediment metagenome TaxID=412755 RepID=A0A0F9M5M0_9ZZZZ|nr:MGMT family protein [Methylophaga sp.]HEC59788.1 MGMT family protein [Methylophaga sp.]
MAQDKLDLNEIIWQVVASIPKGRVATYGHIARLAGYPNHARYVGTTLKKLPAGSAIPWHRIVNAKGELSFAENSAQYQKQKALLESEGVTFKTGKISLSKYSLNGEL